MFEKIEYILSKELANAKHNLYCADRRFSSMSKEELQEEYGQSGSTCAEVWKGYQREVNELKQCLNWLEEVV
jgi:hypothetical protein